MQFVDVQGVSALYYGVDTMHARGDAMICTVLLCRIQYRRMQDAFSLHYSFMDNMHVIDVIVL
jgi:hypothetical protein